MWCADTCGSDRRSRLCGLRMCTLHADKATLGGVQACLFEQANDFLGALAVAKQATLFARHALVDLKGTGFREIVEAEFLRDHIDFAGTRVKIVDGLPAMLTHAGQYMINAFQSRVFIRRRQ